MMTEERSANSRTVADRILEYAEEVEASGDISVDEAELEVSRKILHAWIDAMSGVVCLPSLGRVTIIHDGTESSIASPDLPFLMSKARKKVGG